MGFLEWLRSKISPPREYILPPPPRPPRMTDEEFAPLEAEMAPFKRMCLLPRTEEGEGDGRVVSKFGGAAWIGNGEEWPRCGKCKEPMQLLVQIVTADLRPEDRAVTGDGLLQAFACLAGNCDSGDSSHTAQLVRVVRTAGRSDGGMQPRPDASHQALPSNRVVAWTEALEYPCLCDGSDGWTYERWSRFRERIAEKYGHSLPIAGDKVGGWPFWVQDERIRNCPTCAKPMLPIVQIGSEDNLAWMLGDCGVGHIQLCPQHPERGVWAWECF